MGDSFNFNEHYLEDYVDNGGAGRPLTQEEVITLQETYGPNIMRTGRKRTWYRIFFGALLHPFNMLLTLLAAISGAAQEMKTMGVMLLMVVLSSILRFFQEFKSEIQAQSLLKFVASKVLVIRYDPMLRKEIEFHVPAEELVPGDWIRLAPGDLVPADVEIVEDKEFHVSQAALSGEPLPVHKFKPVVSRNCLTVPSTATGNNAPQPMDPGNFALDQPLLKESRKPSFETLIEAVVSKRKRERDPESGVMSTADLDNPQICFLGSAVISGAAVCRVLRIGSKTLFGQFTELLGKQQEENTFNRGVREISNAFFFTSLTMATLVFLVQGVLTGKWFEAIIFGLSVAVGLTPEMLPMVVNTTLAKGAVTLSKKRCIVKNLDAVVNVGAMKILCTDKTGTLTTSRVNLHRFVNRNGFSSNITLRLGFLNSHFQSVQDGPLDSAIVHYFHQYHFHNALGGNSPGRISPGRRSSRALNGGINIGFVSRFTLLDELPFDFIRRRMSVILHDHVQESSTAVLICKGAVEEVLSVCNKIIIKEEGEVEDILAVTKNEIRTEPITHEILIELTELNEQLIGEGFRLLAVAYRPVSLQEAYGKNCEADLTFAGYLGFLDPPKDSARPAIARLVENGVQVKVLTGDSPLVCKKVCEEIGMKIEQAQVITGEDLRMIEKPGLLKMKAMTCTIFAKLTPVQKADLVKIFQGNDNVVGFLGDGINDAAALSEADVGISVDTGTDIAKESSDIILLDKDLTVLADAVITGRRTFGNAMKYIVITVSSNFGNVFSILIASFWLPFLPIGSFHILVQNLLYDFSQISVPWDNLDADYLKTSHIWSTVGILKFMLFMGPLSTIFDIATFLFLYFYFDIKTADDKNAVRIFQTTWFTVGLLTQSVIVHMIRTPKLPFIQSRASLPVILMTLIVITIGLSLPFINNLAEWIDMAQLPWEVYPFLVGIVVAYCIASQLAKMAYLCLFKRWY